MKDQFIGINVKQKGTIKMQQMNWDILSNQTLFFDGVNTLFVLISLNRDNDVKLFKTWRY